jgi:hypothetical protein
MSHTDCIIIITDQNDEVSRSSPDGAITYVLGEVDTTRRPRRPHIPRGWPGREPPPQTSPPASEPPKPPEIG